MNYILERVFSSIIQAVNKLHWNKTDIPTCINFITGIKVGSDDAILLLGTVSPWSIVPRCPWVLQVLPTMSDSSQVSKLSQSEQPDIVGSTCNTLGLRGTMLHGDTVPCPN